MRQLTPLLILTFTMLAAPGCGTGNTLPGQTPPPGDAASTGGSAGSHDTGGGGAGGSGGGGGSSTAAPPACRPSDCAGQPVPTIGCRSGGIPTFSCDRNRAGGCRLSGPQCSGNGDDGGTPPPKPSKADAGASTGDACRVDSDCRLFDDYCSGCNCRALAKSDPDPTCSGPGVRCLVQPCLRKTATCVGGLCLAR